MKNTNNVQFLKSSTDAMPVARHNGDNCLAPIHDAAGSRFWHYVFTDGVWQRQSADLSIDEAQALAVKSPGFSTDEEIIAQHAPEVRRRALTELAIVHKVIQALKAAGHKLAVDNGEEVTTTDDEQTIVSELFACDEGHIITDGGMSFVFFVFGNNGPDVINDYGTSLEDVMKPVNDWIETESAAGRF